MRIKEVAEKLGISTRAIRFYEQKGLVVPEKQDINQYREFKDHDIWRLQTIVALREAGMSVADIKVALEKIDSKDKKEIQYYLELQRSVMFSKWLEIKQMIETTDNMIQSLKEEHVLPLDDIYQLAKGSKRLREHRNSWKDLWAFDEVATVHDERVTNGDLSKYKDYDKALQLTVDCLSPRTGEKGLDIGTGTGNLAGRLMEKGVDMTGVDQSKEMLRHCAEKFPEMETKLGNFLALPYLESKFDFVVSSFAFHHLTDDQKVLAIHEMRRVLKPHGRICITDLMLTANHPSAPNDEEGLYCASLSTVLALFEDLDYVTKHQQINEQLHIVYAVPIR
ncbi:MerR family transcriptional regulator [Paenibacillus sp. JCM 10914]|uniref:MerR family transcriptional regulator n=1 Tax=Paenibacillus sp. JCM 10914 TaxID=1236974 RepID=UPI0003CC56E3|nr:MerR family transcriptional regulator [Paenibacillus sp. JCM 10914]GAE07444.1 predicted S-adenosylmethionine-dependent methyltransferase [Paenibacillus sp. JCM 10914]